MPRMVDQLEIGPNTLKLLKERYELLANSPSADVDGFDKYVRRLIHRDIKPLVRKIWMEAKVQGERAPYLPKLYKDVMLTFLEEERASSELIVAIGLAEKKASDRKVREQIIENQKKANANMKAIRRMKEQD